MIWGGDAVLAVEGQQAQLFAQGPDLAREVGPGLNRVYHLDALGTVQAVSRGGLVETRYRRDVWGNVLSRSAAGNPYIYLGGLGYWYEPDLGLDYVRARWLDPGVGRRYSSAFFRST